MRWPDERYVRLYTRDTIDWLALSFEAQGLLALLLRKADRAGLIKLGRHGKRGVAAALGHAHRWAVIGLALEELLADGVVVLGDEALVVRNFVEAQEAQQSDAARKRAQRERDRDKFLAQGNPEATSGDACRKVAEIERSRVTEQPEGVTEQLELSPPVVTQDGHAGKVTPSLTSLAEPPEPLKTGAAHAPPRARKPKADPSATSDFRDLQNGMVQDFADCLGGKYAWNGAKDTEALKKLLGVAEPPLIRARWCAGLRATGWTQVSTVAQLWTKWNDLGRMVPAEREPEPVPEQPDTPAGRRWAELLDAMREHAPYAAQTFAKFRGLEMQGELLIIEAPDQYAVSWAKDNFDSAMPFDTGGPVGFVPPVPAEVAP
jgi:hypothetical protein